MADSVKDTMGEPILVSACLLGLPTRYDGRAKRSQPVLDYLERHKLVKVETRRGDPAVQELEHRLFAKQHEFLDLPQCCFFFTADDD